MLQTKLKTAPKLGALIVLMLISFQDRYLLTLPINQQIPNTNPRMSRPKKASLAQSQAAATADHQSVHRIDHENLLCNEWFRDFRFTSLEEGPVPHLDITPLAVYFRKSPVAPRPGCFPGRGRLK